MYRKLNTFIDFCKKNRIDESVILAIPYIGNSLHRLLYADKDEATLRELRDQIVKEIEKHSEVIGKINLIMNPTKIKSPYIVSIGSGVAEEVKIIKGKFRVGHKHTADTKELIGGSGVNYAFRLIHTNYDVFPILPIGTDRLGKNIKEKFIEITNKFGSSDNVLNFIKSDNFLSTSIKTPSSTIIVSDGEPRTIISSEPHGNETFIDHLKKQIICLDKEISEKIDAVMIGHIYGDYLEDEPSRNGECSKYIIKYFKDSLLFANFGNSQLKMGIDFWIDDIKKLDIFQLNCSEIKEFFKVSMEKKKSLLEIMDWLRKKEITAIITVDKFGAIGTYKDGRDGVVIAWPIKNIDVIDTTGAGDAFAAGMISELAGNKKFSFYEFYKAIGVARTWAAYACTTVGGSGNCPDKFSLEDFHEKIHKDKIIPVETKDWRDAERFIEIFDDASK